MRSGQLRHRIIVEVRSSSQDAAGQQVDSWATFAVIWASFESPAPGRGVAREIVAAGAVQNAQMQHIRIRYLQGMVPGMRVNFGGRYLNVIMVQNVGEMNREAVLVCEEGMASG